ncbi:MAG: bifunctional phosphoribosylaminoimidazolecarboxamide formyltransferase/IMP cyclohydrolase [Xanthomonadales bacterium]|nr:bifunctional phosphoribosylaminoimidazolecarboxamide formyltransferase/IMP cyclohydrolase [Xanthomonadales bacterium]
MSDLRQPVRRALLSVSDKQGLLPLAARLHAAGVHLLSTGGTARLLREHGLSVTDVSRLTGFPEIMDGRVKTLHPRVHGGLLGREGVDDEVMKAHGIEPIDLLVVNLYPFEATVAAPDCSYVDGVENIDIGGPAMLRAAAKNHARVSVVVDPADYDDLITAIEAGGTTPSQRRALAAKAYAHTAHYDGQIAMWLSRRIDAADSASDWPESWHVSMRRSAVLRYGENPHQRGALFVEPGALEGTVSGARFLQGRELSYNNIADADAALACVRQFSQPACVIVKHANPCGVAVADSIYEAYDRAYVTDPTSAFGGIIAFNRTLDGVTAKEIIARQFVEVVIAPDVRDDALPFLAKKPNVRVLVCGALKPAQSGWHYQRVAGGLLVQDADRDSLGSDDLQVVSQRQPNADELGDLLFAWKVAMFVKSNAIVYARHRQTVGIGAGQMSRVVSARIASLKAEEASLPVVGAVMASDAFFPFRDGIDAAAKAGIRAVIQPGGSMRDKEVIAAADEHGMAMVFTGRRHFRH